MSIHSKMLLECLLAKMSLSNCVADLWSSHKSSLNLRRLTKRFFASAPLVTLNTLNKRRSSFQLWHYQSLLKNSSVAQGLTFLILPQSLAYCFSFKPFLCTFCSSAATYPFLHSHFCRHLLTLLKNAWSPFPHYCSLACATAFCYHRLSIKHVLTSFNFV